MNDAFVCHAIQNRDSFVIGSRGLGLVFGFNGGYYLLDVGAHHGTEAGVVAAAIFRLFGAFAGLCSICQGKLLNIRVFGLVG